LWEKNKKIGEEMWGCETFARLAVVSSLYHYMFLQIGSNLNQMNAAVLSQVGRRLGHHCKKAKRRASMRVLCEAVTANW